MGAATPGEAQGRISVRGEGEGDHMGVDSGSSIP